MDIKPALKSQYGAGLAMLRQAIERCPDTTWIAGTHPRNFWRIAYHAIFYTHLYLASDLASFQAWEKHRDSVRYLWGMPDMEPPYTQAELLEYLDWLIAALPPFVDSLNLDATETGFDWYPNMGKLEHQFVNIRHLQGHVGQLSELLMAQEIYTDWVGNR
ncbi:MAG: hypothetical protein QM758_15325 [Armatimonas sp.]